MGVTAATEAALWARSMGTCYAPGCAQPVIVEIKPSTPRKNVQVAHIYSTSSPLSRTSVHPKLRELPPW
ncbi:MAG: hypothetical protein ACRDTM_10370 [Micromonosporaceae bacterium]